MYRRENRDRVRPRFADSIINHVKRTAEMRECAKGRYRKERERTEKMRK